MKIVLFLATILTAAISLPSLAQDVVTVTPVIDGGTGGLAVDTVGNIYIGDFGPDLNGGGTRVFRSTPGGSVEVFATGFNGASGNDFDSAGNLFQSNVNAGRIDKIAPDATVTPFVSTGIVAPVGIAIDDADTLYVCNCGNNTVRKVTPAGVSTQLASNPLLNCPNGITFASDGNLYVSNFSNGSVLKVGLDGSVTHFATIPGGNNGHLTFHDGLFYVAARTANQIYTITLSGDVSLFAGSGVRGILDGSLEQAQFSLPNDVIADPTGSFLYVNDVVDPFGVTDTSPMVLRRINLSPVAGIDQASGLEESAPFLLRSIGPNPFRSQTAISFGLDRSMAVAVTIYDVLGRQVRTVLDRELSAGDHRAVWTGDDRNARPVAPGVYFYRIETPVGVQSGRIQLLP